MHKVYVLIVAVGMCVQRKGRDREEDVSNCALHLSVGMSFEQAGEFGDAHGVEGGGSWAFGLEVFWFPGCLRP